MLSDFFAKLMKLPLSYFESKVSGDIMQRITDHQRIQNLLTVSSLNIMFSVFNVLVLGLVLVAYNFYIFAIFFVCSVAYIVWTALFFRRRKELDYQLFTKLSQNQEKVIELIGAMREIKLNNAEQQKRWGWEYIQASIFRVEIKSLSLSQVQSVGSFVISHLQNISISILTAKLVIDGDLSFGMMLAIFYIIGQLNSPVHQFIGFIQAFQDAKISLERINEIYDIKAEDNLVSAFLDEVVELRKDLVFENVTFRYPGAHKPALDNVSFKIPADKTTAIVGLSGSGKTTVLKLLQKAFEPGTGTIRLGDTDLRNISHKFWRTSCGFVLQDGFIFKDTIKNNITMGDESADKEQLINSATIANIHNFIKDLPRGYNTELGSEGIGLSTGQNQRVLIARAVYKDPQIILLDEPTSALDSNNEKIILSHLTKFLRKKTSIFIAHRLSTIKDADHVIVLEEGKVVEVGIHHEMLERRGHYFNLVKNQLELEKNIS
jgi:ATP-binding cassette subfamily B protein